MPNVINQGKAYTLDKLLRVLEAQQQMHEILLRRELTDEQKTVEACALLRPIYRDLTKAMAAIADVRWEEADAELVFRQGRAGVDALASRYDGAPAKLTMA